MPISVSDMPSTIRVFITASLVLFIVGCTAPTVAPSVSSTQSPSEKGSTMTDLVTCLIGRWMHSHEEDTDKTEIYRPKEYAFPPARGRTGYEFMPDGQAIYIGIAAADGSTQTPGRWELDASDRVSITAEDPRIERRVLHVLDCSPDKLVVSN